ncbi:MAG TPA: sigma-70 family RNA polymerase sigma factor [Terriglobia bacterium]|nr:sigma-70 family RNA polymerase sigma factor [Terriglobia bacterium]
MEPNTDRETAQQVGLLLLQATSNNREALDDLFTRYRHRLYRTALRLMGNSEDAEDALQDGLLAAFRSLSGFAGRSQFSTWLTRIVVNAALMRLRHGHHLEVMTSIDQKLDRDTPALADRIPDPGPNPEEIYARQERLQMLEETLQSLPAAYRQALWLCDLQGMSIREAAEALELPVGTLKSQLHRARLRLSEKLAEARPARRFLQSSRGDSVRTRHRPTMKLTEEITEPAT